MEISEHLWKALCLCTESNRPEEWPYISEVIDNRVLSPRYPNSVRDVVLQPKQFSAFNAWTGKKTTATAIGYRGLYNEVFDAHVGDAALLALAVEDVICAFGWGRWGKHGVIVDPVEFPSSVLHYYSPISMKPKGSAPAWAKQAKRLFTPPGIDPERFVFAEGVP